MWAGVRGLIQEIKKCQIAGATTSAITMAFICMDTMAFLALPAGRKSQQKNDFITWVDAYLKGSPGQPYQYSGLDVYGARCAVLHTFGSEVDFHQQNPDAKKFCYSDGGRHAFNPQMNERLVIIGTASFLDDVVRAVGVFLETCKTDTDLRKRVEGRLPKVLVSFPLVAE
jgi:hypothetical protein